MRGWSEEMEQGTKIRLYHIVAINEKTGKTTYCTSYPMSHKEACVILKKFSNHPARRVQLEEIK